MTPLDANEKQELMRLLNEEAKEVADVILLCEAEPNQEIRYLVRRLLKVLSCIEPVTQLCNGTVAMMVLTHIVTGSPMTVSTVQQLSSQSPLLGALISAYYQVYPLAQPPLPLPLTALLRSVAARSISVLQSFKATEPRIDRLGVHDSVNNTYQKTGKSSFLGHPKVVIDVLLTTFNYPLLSSSV